MAAETVGFVGLGQMGTGMATNLQHFLQSKPDARPLLVHNRTRDRADPLLALGCEWVDSPRELASRCDIVFSMLAKDEALQAVFDEYLAGGPRTGAVYVDCSTVYPTTTQELAARAEAAGVQYIACPVFGRPEAAHGRQLVAAPGGPSSAVDRVRPYIEGMSRAVLYVGQEQKAASAFKLLGNFFIASLIEIVGEGMALADATGIPRALLLSFFDHLLPAPLLKGYSERIASGQFDLSQGGGFALELAKKDLGHMARLSAEYAVPMPTLEAALRHLHQGLAAGRGGLDWGAIALSVKDNAETAAKERGSATS